MNIGDIFMGDPKFMSYERVVLFSGGNNIHSDIQVAKKCGLDQTYVSATQYLGHVVQLLVKTLGVRFHFWGKIYDTKFLKPVAIGDTLQSFCKVVNKIGEKYQDMLVFDIWVENQDGEKVLVGKARGVDWD